MTRRGEPPLDPGVDLVDRLVSSVPAPSGGEQAMFAIGAMLALIVLAVLLWVGTLSFGRGGDDPDALFKGRGILTANELEFYNRMVSALPGYVILCQVSMSALLEPRAEEPSEYMRHRSKIAQKYVDFVVCEPGSLQVLCVVELDDVTHDEAKDAARDEILNGAGYEVVRWHSRRKPDRAAIARTIRELEKTQVRQG